jgi:hypothetical protein
MLSSNRFLNDLMAEVSAREASTAPRDPVAPPRDKEGRFATDLATQTEREFRASLKKIGVSY